MIRSRPLLLLLLVLLPGCALLGKEETQPVAGPEDGLDVVDDVGPFDPSEAVDDPDQLSAEPGRPSPEREEEHVAGPAEVEARRAARADARASTAGESDGAVKAALAGNPPPEKPPDGEPFTATLLDYALELLLLVLAAAAITALIFFGRRHPIAVPTTLVLLLLWLGTLVRFRYGG